jgi:uncharacterized protein involved in exopolysaccharide biosynthesis
MKRTIRFLAQLYPSIWRKRYGAEFDALLEDAKLSADDVFDIFWGALKMQMTTWSFGRITLACSVVGILLAAAVSFAVPVHYVSQGVLKVTPADGSTSTGESGRYLVSTLAGNIFSREYLASVIQEHNLYPRERARRPLDDVIDKMKRNITLEAMPLASPGNRDTLTFVVQFDYSDAHLAQQVNEELMSRLIEGNLESAQRLNSNWTFRVPDPPSLPLNPAAPNRTQFAAIGLSAGLLAGLTLAIVFRRRSSTTVGNA